jgi:hypothetical protein
MQAAPTDDLALEGARLLLGVARLGDGDLKAWWNSAALDADVGGFVLPNTFKRTARIVGAELLLLSAARRHDQLFSRPNALHLFSDQLSFHRWTQSWLAEQKTNQVHPLVGELESWHQPADAVDRLSAWTGPARSGTPTMGTIELGTVERTELEDGDSLLARARMLAACYVDMDRLTPPYFNLSR